MEKVWNYDGFMGDVRAVPSAISSIDGGMGQDIELLLAGEPLFLKLEDDPANPQFIVTRRGLGYLFRAE